MTMSGKVEPPETGAATYWDSDPKVAGFGVRVYAAGAKSFFLNYRIDGRERRYTIGAYPLWSVDGGARAGQGATHASRPGSRPRRRQARAPRGAHRARPDRPLHRDHLPRKAAAHFADDKRMLAEIGKHLGPHTKVDGCARRRHPGHAPQDQRIDRPRRPATGAANRILAVCSKMFSLSLVPMPGENTALAQCRSRQSVQGHRAQSRGGARAVFQPSGVGGDQRRPERVSRRRGRLRAPDHAHRLQAGRGDAGGVVGVRQGAGLLDQAVRPHQAAQGAQAAAEPGGDRADRPAAQEARTAIGFFPATSRASTWPRSGTSGISSGSEPGSAKTRACTICATRSPASAPAAA